MTAQRELPNAEIEQAHRDGNHQVAATRISNAAGLIHTIEPAGVIVRDSWPRRSTYCENSLEDPCCRAVNSSRRDGEDPSVSADTLQACSTRPHLPPATVCHIIRPRMRRSAPNRYSRIHRERAKNLILRSPICAEVIDTL
jgi:hypothetical protein